MIPSYSLAPVFGISISEQRKIYFNHRNTLISLLSNTLIAVSTPKGAVNRFVLVSPLGDVYHYDKRHLFRMANEHHHFEAGHERLIIANRLKNDYILCPDMRQRSIAACYQNNVAWLYRMAWLADIAANLL